MHKDTNISANNLKSAISVLLNYVDDTHPLFYAHESFSVEGLTWDAISTADKKKLDELGFIID